MTSIPRSRYRGPRLLLLAGLILLAAAVTQCRMVTDSVTRPQESGAEISGRGGSCFSACAHAMIKALHREHERHKDAIEDCRKNKECKRQEHERHKEAIKAIIAARKECQANCHHQGGGKGGR